MIRPNLAIPTVLTVCCVAVGCGDEPGKKAELPKPMVVVATPTSREVTQYEHFTGRVEASDNVDVKAKVSGYLTKIYFKPGDEVIKDAPLFEIDPELFKAELAKAKGNLAKAEAEGPITKAAIERADARVARTYAEYQRADRLVRTLSLSQEDLDKAKAEWLESKAVLEGEKAKVAADKAAIEAAKASLQTAQLNVDYCTVKAPIAGRLGDKLVSEGNLISGGFGGTTTLTTIVSLEPINVRFEVDENTVQRLQEAVRAGLIPEATPGTVPAELGLAIDEGRYPHKGMIAFVNNRVDPKTGTIQLKAEFPNPKPSIGPRVLTPGMFARIRVPIGKPRMSLLVPEAAVLSDQGIRYIFTLGPEDRVKRLDVTPGVLTPDGWRVVESVRTPGDAQGRPLRPDERIIVSGLQRIRPEMAVEPKPALAQR